MNLTIGDKVETCVYVCGERRAVRTGVIVGFQGTFNDVARVDIASLHGCAPWVVLEATSSLNKLDS